MHGGDAKRLRFLAIARNDIFFNFGLIITHPILKQFPKILIPSLELYFGRVESS